jgi:hypothetical protein
MRRSAIVTAAFSALLVGWAAGPSAQSKPTVTPAEYEQFETLTAGAARGGLSPDGRWLAYGINRVGGNNELRLAATGTPGATTSAPEPRVMAFGTQAAFTSNSKWLGYAIGHSEAEQERLRTARQPIQRKFGLVELATGTETTIDAIESFAFDRTAQSVALKRYGPAAAPGAPAAAGPPPAAGRGGGAPPSPPVGTTLLVRDLASGTTTTFGNVTEFAWQPSDTGRLLAMVISAEGQAGNGIHLFNAETSVLRVLDAAAADYSSLVWRDDSADLVALRTKTDEKRDGPTHMAVAWTSLGQGNERALVLDPTAGALPDAQRIVTFRRPSWIEGTDARIVLGVGEWAPKPAEPAGGRGGRGGTAAAERPDVDVWHWNDTTVMARQKQAVAADARRNRSRSSNAISSSSSPAKLSRLRARDPLRPASIRLARSV